MVVSAVARSAAVSHAGRHMGSQEFVVRLAHPDGKYIGTHRDVHPPGIGSVIEVGNRRWRVVESPAPVDPRGTAVVVVVPEHQAST
jgi:hypothetical protein